METEAERLSKMGSYQYAMRDILPVKDLSMMDEDQYGIRHRIEPLTWTPTHCTRCGNPTIHGKVACWWHRLKKAIAWLWPVRWLGRRSRKAKPFLLPQGVGDTMWQFTSFQSLKDESEPPLDKNA